MGGGEQRHECIDGITAGRDRALNECIDGITAGRNRALNECIDEVPAGRESTETRVD